MQPWDTPEEGRHIKYKELFVSFGYDFKFDPIAQISTAKILIAQNYTAFVSIAQSVALRIPSKFLK